MDLYVFPHGLYRQEEPNRFLKLDILSFNPAQYDAAVCNWVDLDNDGRVDVLMALNEVRDFKYWWQLSPNARSPDSWRLMAFRNTDPVGNNWLQIKVRGQDGNPEAIGARLELVSEIGKQVQEVGASDGAFFSQGHYRLYFGLGRVEVIDQITVRWSDGFRRTFRAIPANGLITIARDGPVRHEVM